MTMKLGNEAHFNALFHYLHSLSEEREEMHQSYIKAKFEVFEVHCSMTLVFLLPTAFGGSSATEVHLRPVKRQAKLIPG